MSAADALRLASERPLDFTLQYPPSRAYFRARFAAAEEPVPFAALRRVLLYVHVPFCEAKCSYCNFAVDLRRGDALHGRYVDAVCTQLARLDAALPPGCALPGIDVGGGTPTLLSAPLLARLLAALAPFLRRCEVPHPLSIETTPRVAASDPARLAVLRAHGVSRVSLGLQSTNDETLAGVNRRAQRHLGDRAVDALAKAGFRRVNADLVFGLPGQTLAQWREDLDRVAALPLDSITTYDCLYRGAGRAFGKRAAARPSPDHYGALYDLAFERLGAAGFHATYGSLNFSRHPAETGTSPYFEGRLLDGLPYLGAGTYASSLLGERWWFAPYETDGYVDAIDAGAVLPQGDGYLLPLAERAAKYALLSLSFGVLDRRRFRAALGVDLEEVFAEPLACAVCEGWLRESGGVYRVAPGQFGRMPWLRALFYSKDALAWLAQRAEPQRLSRRGA